MLTLRQLGIASALVATAAASPSLPADAATTQVSGLFTLDTSSTCAEPPGGFNDDFTFVVTGDLGGCWYTDVVRSRDFGPPTGLYLETGRDLFVGQVRGGPEGTFLTTYSFESRWDPSYTAGGTEIWGRCQHLITRSTGTGGLHDVTGIIARTDIASDGSIGRYRGSIHQE
jgi:hypothetical protein